jgi:hypothetical protein
MCQGLCAYAVVCVSGKNTLVQESKHTHTHTHTHTHETVTPWHSATNEGVRRTQRTVASARD